MGPYVADLTFLRPFSVSRPFALDPGFQASAGMDGSIFLSNFEPVGFAPGPSGGVVLRHSNRVGDRDIQHEATVALELLDALDRKHLVADVFEKLLREYIRSLPMLEEAGQGMRIILLMQVVMMMCEKLGASIVSDLEQGARIVGMMIETGRDENIMVSLELLTVLLGGMVHLNKDEAAVLASLLPLLEPLRAHAVPEIATKADDVAISIATRSTKWVNDKDGGGSDPAAQEEDRSALSEVLRDLADEQLPVRAHALIALRRLVEAKDPVTTRNVPYILGLFESQLGDADTYMYFAAINGLVSLGDVFPVRVVPVLARKFRDVAVGTENRLKLGEAMMRVARACGQALPHHINMFVPAILEVVRDRDATMRASSLSNLATICEYLQFSLYTFLEEVIACLTSILKTDDSDEVRRGACSVLTGILRGAESDAFDVLGAATLKVCSSSAALPPTQLTLSLGIPSLFLGEFF